jgi:hypothetical protein
MKKTAKTRKKAKREDLATKVRLYIHAKESGKRGYQRSDRLLEEIAQRSRPGKEIVLDRRGRKAVLRDRFAQKNIVWQPCAARRWELEIIDP